MAVSADVQRLINIRDQEIANLDAATAAPKPSYSIDGESVDWTTYTDRLLVRIEQLNKLIVARSPYFIVTRQTL